MIKGHSRTADAIFRQCEKRSNAQDMYKLGSEEGDIEAMECMEASLKSKTYLGLRGWMGRRVGVWVRESGE